MKLTIRLHLVLMLIEIKCVEQFPTHLHVVDRNTFIFTDLMVTQIAIIPFMQ